MSSDSDDEEQIKQFLEAADTTLLNNAMFQGNTNDGGTAALKDNQIEKDFPKSQRYILDDGSTNGIDFNLPETMQKHMAKKLSDILKQVYEFCDIPVETCANKKKHKTKSRVKLLSGDETYVNSYEDFEYETRGPEKKPVIKRRCVEKERAMDHNERLKSVAIDGGTILSGAEPACWSKKKERKNKIFHYKAGAKGVLHAKEEVNEFSAARRKNKWNENKIKDFKIK